MIDSGATVNVIPATFVKDNRMEHLLKKGKKLDISVYGGKKVRTEGTMRVELINPVNRRKVTASVMVVNEKIQPILSCSLCQKLNLIRFNLNQFVPTVSAVECDDLKEQNPERHQKTRHWWFHQRDFTRIPRRFWRESWWIWRRTNTPNRAEHSSYTTTHKRCPICTGKTI